MMFSYAIKTRKIVIGIFLLLILHWSHILYEKKIIVKLNQISEVYEILFYK